MKKVFTALQNKWPEYLIESLVIVASILGAYALDSWNESQKESKLELIYLNNIRDDVEAQLNIIEKQIDFEKKCKSATSYLLNKGINVLLTENPDTMTYLISCLQVRNTFSIADATFDDLKSTGNIRLISNEKLKHLFVTYYQDLERIERIVLSNNEKLVDESFNNGLLQSGLVNILPDVQNPETAYIKIVKVSPNEKPYYAHSLKKLENIDNQMMLSNLIKVRASAPSTHLILMNQLKLSTQHLFETIQSELKK